MSVNRRGQVQTSATALTLQMRDLQNAPPNPPTRPTVGGNQDGWHYQPNTGDEVVVLTEKAGWTTTCVAATRASQIAAMTPGTSTLFSQGISLLSASGGTCTLSHATLAGTLTLSGAITATSATAGSAAALPAQPAGYLEVDVNNTTVKIPYYLP